MNICIFLRVKFFHPFDPNITLESQTDHTQLHTKHKSTRKTLHINTTLASRTRNSSKSMSASISSRELDSNVGQWRGDRSVGSCRSSKSGSRNGGSRSNSRSGSASLSSSSLSHTRRFVVGDDDESHAMYLPNSLLQRQHRNDITAIDCDEKSLQELDDTVASVAKQYSSSSLDKGETSPTSVSYDVAGSTYAKDPLEEKVIRHLTGAMPLDLKRVESVSGRSIVSRTSRSSRGSRTTLRSRSSRRNDRLEQRIYQTILENETEISDFSYSAKECSDSACRSAQFILSDLFQEASKAMNEEATPRSPFVSQEPPAGDRCLSLPASLPPRHPDVQNSIDDHQVLVATSSPESKHPSSHLASNEVSQKNLDSASNSNSYSIEEPPMKKVADCVSEIDRRTTGISPPGRIGITNETENESETSSFYVFDMQDPAVTNGPTIKRDNSMNSASSSNVTGPLNYSIDELQYSTTNGTSFSQQGRDTPVSFSSKSNVEQGTIQENNPSPGDQAAEPSERDFSGGDDWTCFDASPFQEQNFTDDFGFDTFLPFESDVAKSKQPVEDVAKQEEIDPAWDTSKVIPGPSPNSPSSVFNFFTDDAEDGIDDDVVLGAEAEGIWNIGKGSLQETSGGYIEGQASF